jgi:subtilisin family serine protease
MMHLRGAHPRFRLFTHPVIFAGVIWLAWAGMAVAAFAPRPVPGRLLLKLRDGIAVNGFTAKPGSTARITGQPGLDALTARFGVQSFEAQFPGETHASKALAGTDLSSFFIVEFPEDVDLATIQAAYASDPAVEVAEFDVMQPISVDVNDAGQQWHLESSQGKDAHVSGGWNHSSGDTTVILAIADTGVDWQHPDLGGSGPNYINGNIWINWQEYNGVPGVDDDANGKIDDVRGWDFVDGLVNAWPGEDGSNPDADPRDFNGHGTHVAGIAGAMTNNGVGVAGVGWHCKVMALRIGGSINDNGGEQGVVLMSAAAEAINYARQKGAAALNCSWGSSNISSLAAAVNAAVAQGMVICVAAGNDNSATPSYLSSRGDCFDVAATGSNDVKASFSNYGSWVDVAAPGVAIYSTYYNHNGPVFHTYANLQGTSMAAPVVTGLVGLVKAMTPALTGAQIKAMIQSGCDNIDALNPGLAGLLGAGRVNALRTFNDYHLTVPTDYSTFEKALAARGKGDSVALRGGDVYTSPMYLWKKNVMILGGWDASFTSRDPVNNPTVVQVVSGPALEIVAGMDSSLVVDGLSFSGGVARAISVPVVGNFGGGALCIDASPVLRNCRFTSNTAGDFSNAGGGGGGFFANSTAHLIDCTFANNAAHWGAGLYAYQSNLVIQGGSVSGNTNLDGTVLTTGGGIHAVGSTLSLIDVTIENNVGADEGGGIYLQNATLTGEGVALSSNAAASSGGNMRMTAGSAVVLRGSELRGGTASFGGGISAVSGASMTLTSCIVAGNVAAYIGAGIHADGAQATFQNVTFDDNQATAIGFDAVYAASCPSSWVLRNCLVTNHPTATNAALWFTGSAPQLDFNTFWANAGGNLSGGALGPADRIEDPLYVDAPAGDLALGLHSPALDSGDPLPASNDPDGTRSDRGGYGGPDARSRAPLPPTGLVAERVSNPVRNTLSWDPPASADTEFFAVYRGATPDFVPSSATYIGTAPAASPAFEDPAGGVSDWYCLASIDSSGASSGFGPALQPSPSTDAPRPVPTLLVLHPNVPNPFNPSTSIAYDLPRDTHVQLWIYDPKGRLVRKLVESTLPAGTYRAQWDGRDDAGRGVRSGVYWARLIAGPDQRTRKLVVVR